MVKTVTKLIVLSISFTSNNIVFTLTQLNGNVIFWTSSGTTRVKGTKKTTLTTLTNTIKSLVEHVNVREYESVYIKTKGFNKNKKNILKYFKIFFTKPFLISEETRFPHNGCRISKTRRI